MSSFRSPSPDASSGSGIFSIERIVALVTPLFGIAAGWLSTEAATLVGVQIPRADFVAIFIAGFTGAVAAALKWLHGRQKFVNFTTDAEHVAQQVVGEIHKNVPSFALADIESLLKDHQTSIVAAVEADLGKLSPSAEKIAQEVFQQLWRNTALQAPASAVVGRGEAIGGSAQVQPGASAGA